MSRPQPTVAEVRRFWETSPLASAAIAAEPGTPEFYARFRLLREAVEPPAFQERFYEYGRYAGQRVLDVGCGNGYILSQYARHRARVTGVDLTSKGTWLSARRFALEGLPGNFLQANAEALPFRDASFDLVCSMGVLHHTPDTERAVAEIHRVLRPGGCFLVMLYHRDSLAYRFAFNLARYLKPSFRGRTLQQMANRVDGEANPLGKVYSRPEMARLLGAFSSLEQSVACLEASHFGRRWLGELVPARARERLARRWGWFLYARARKRA